MQALSVTEKVFPLLLELICILNYCITDSLKHLNSRAFIEAGTLP